MFCDKLTLGLEALAEAAGEATGAAAKAIYIRRTISCCGFGEELGTIDVQKVAGLASMVLCYRSARELCIGDWGLEKLALNHASCSFFDDGDDIENSHASFAGAFLSSKTGQSCCWNLTCGRGNFVILSTFPLTSSR